MKSQHRREADRQIVKLLAISTPAERERIRAARQQGREWRMELEQRIGNGHGSSGRRPAVNNGQDGIYDS